MGSKDFVGKGELERGRRREVLDQKIHKKGEILHWRFINERSAKGSKLAEIPWQRQEELRGGGGGQSAFVLWFDFVPEKKGCMDSVQMCREPEEGQMVKGGVKTANLNLSEKRSRAGEGGGDLGIFCKILGLYSWERKSSRL